MNYRKRLAAHPGKELAALLTVMFMVSAHSAGFWGALAIGVFASLPIWSIVLWTARTQPIPEDRKVKGVSP